MVELKQNTATDRLIFMTDATDHVTGKTGLTLTITASKAGGAFASITPTVTERGNGWYSLALTTAHTDTLNDLALHITATGADPTDRLFNVVANLEADTFTRIGAAGAGLSAIPWNAAWDAEVQSEAADALADVGLTTVVTGRIDAAISTRSTYDGSDTAGTTTLLARLTVTRADNLDNLDAAVSSRLAPTTASRTLDVSATGEADVNVVAVAGATGGVVGFERAIRGIVTGAVGTGSTTTSIVTSSLTPNPGVTDGLKGRIVVFDRDTTTAALRGQATDVISSTAGGVLTVTALTTAPADTDSFVIQ